MTVTENQKRLVISKRCSVDGNMIRDDNVDATTVMEFVKKNSTCRR